MQEVVKFTCGFLHEFSFNCSRLELLPRMNKDGTPAKPRAPSKFSLFVKANYRKVKTNEPGSSHQEIMKELSKRFAEASLKKDE